MTTNRTRTIRQEIQQHHCQTRTATLPIGMGCATIGGQADREDLRRFQATLDAAYERGIRYYDTSVNYGGSEFRLGEFLRRAPRAELFVATKSGIPPAYTPAEARVHMRQAIRNSRERLGIDVIDLYQIHDVDTLDQALTTHGALEALVEARDAGEIRYIGLGSRYHDLLETAALRPEFDTILTYTDFTPLNQTARTLISLAAVQDVGVINGSPLAFGLLTGQDPRHNPRIHGEFRRYIRLAAKLYDYCAERGVAVLSVALQYPMRNSDISLTLTGPGSPEELHRSLDAALETIPPDMWQELANRLN